jgi:Protein of unknown function (DUF3631)
MMTLAEMARRLGGEVSGGQVRCPGPGHSPADRSLAVKLNDKGDGIVVYSHSGDDIMACKDMVRAKLGLQPFRKAKTNGKDHKGIVAEYDYRDENGVLLFQVVRLEPKSFRQRKPDGKGGWTWKLGDCRRVLYQLPELIEGIASGHPCFVVEGEKDVQSLNAMGIVATTNPAGCGKWHREFTPYLRGADVILIPDQDECGWRHMDDVGAQLVGVAARVRVLILGRDAKDVSAWIEGGGTREHLDALVALAPDWKAPQTIPPPSSEAKTAAQTREDELLNALAEARGLDYQRQLRDAAKELELPAKALDNEVRARREDAVASPLYGFWIVEPAPGPVDGGSLLRDIIARLKRHVIVSDDNALTIALWIMLAWLHDEIATHSPILNINSAEPESGKSTTMGLIAFLMPKCIASVEVSEAAMFRAIKRWSPSFCFDEFDSILADDDKSALRSVINSGHTRGQGVLRCIGEDKTPELFSTFAPKAIGMVGRKLPPPTLSRCIFVELRRRRKDEAIDRFEHIDDPGLADLRSRLHRWSMDHEDALRNAQPAMPEALQNRRADNWRLQFAIADLCSGVEDFGARAREAAIKIEGRADSRTTGVKLLTDIKALFDADPAAVCLSSVDIVAALIADSESPWAEYARGKPLTQNRLAKLLGPYGIISQTVRLKEKTARGYKRSQFTDVWSFYVL